MDLAPVDRHSLQGITQGGPAEQSEGVCLSWSAIPRKRRGWMVLVPACASSSARRLLPDQLILDRIPANPAANSWDAE